MSYLFRTIILKQIDVKISKNKIILYNSITIYLIKIPISQNFENLQIIHMASIGKFNTNVILLYFFGINY